MGELQKNNELIMQFWNDDIVFVTKKMKNVDSKSMS
jgi:hypothetical protein